MSQKLRLIINRLNRLNLLRTDKKKVQKDANAEDDEDNDEDDEDVYYEQQDPDQKISNNARVLLGALRSHIPSAFLVSSNPDSSSDTVFCSYDYDHKHKCIHGKKHDKINGFMYQKESNMYAGCYSEKCKPLKPVIIGSINIIDSENDWANENVTEFNSDFISNDENIMKQLHEFMTNDKDKSMTFGSVFGSGKTTVVKDALNIYFDKYGKDKRVLTFSLTQAYAKDVTNNAYKDLGFANYLETPREELGNKNRLIISLESLHKLFEGELQVYDVFVIDEPESSLVQFFSSTVKLNRDCFSKFVTLLRMGKKIIFLDANVSKNRTLNFIKYITSRHVIVRNRYRPKKKTYRVTNNFDRYYAKIKADIESGKNVCIVSVNRAFGSHIYDKLIKDFPELAEKIVFLHGKCKKEHKRELDDVNKNWIKYRVLIYNTVIRQGLDFHVAGHFHNVYAYITGGICSPRDILQMTGRIRKPVTSIIDVYVDASVNIKTDSILYSLEYAQKYCQTLLSGVKIDTVTLYYKNENDILCIHEEQTESIWNTMRATFVQEQILNSSNSNIMTMFKLLVESNGDIYEEDYDEVVKKIDMKSDLDRILEVVAVNDEEYKKLLKQDQLEKNSNIKSVITEKDQLVMEKVQLRHELNLNDKIPHDKLNECVKVYVENKAEITNILNAYKIKDDNVGIDALEKAKMHHLKTAYKKIVDALGCEFLTEPKILTAEEYSEMTKDLEFSKAEILSLNSKGRLRDKYQIIKAVLDRHGINTNVLYNTSSKDKKRITVKKYKITSNQKINEIKFVKTFFNKEKWNESLVEFV